MSDLIVPRPGDTDNSLLQKILRKLGALESSLSVIESILGGGGGGAEGTQVQNDIFADTALHNGNWWSFHAVTDCDIDTLTFASGTGSLDGVRISAGDRVEGHITGIRLDAGVIRMLRII